jgi:hypothetical protein
MSSSVEQRRRGKKNRTERKKFALKQNNYVTLHRSLLPTACPEQSLKSCLVFISLEIWILNKDLLKLKRCIQWKEKRKREKKNRGKSQHKKMSKSQVLYKCWRRGGLYSLQRMQICNANKITVISTVCFSWTWDGMESHFLRSGEVSNFMSIPL